MEEQLENIFYMIFYNWLGITGLLLCILLNLINISSKLDRKGEDRDDIRS